MKLFNKLSLALAVMFLMASCELTQTPLEFEKNPGPPIIDNGQGDETGPNPMDDGPPE